MANPLISVVVTGKSDGARSLESLQSLRSQTFTDYELVECDSSTSGAAAKNTGISRARGEFIAFLDCDDLWLPRKLEKQANKLAANPVLNWCYCDADIVESKTGQVVTAASRRDKLAAGNILGPLLLNNFIPPSTVIVRKSILDEAGMFNESELFRLSEEWDMWLRIAASHAVGVIAEPLVQVRHTSGAIEQLARSRQRVVETAVDRHSDHLKDLRSESLANICVIAGNAYVAADDRAEARYKFAEALTHVPLRADAYLSWMASFFPLEGQRQMVDLHNLGRRVETTETTIEKPLMPQ